jgi:hypothetical protein
MLLLFASVNFKHHRTCAWLLSRDMPHPAGILYGMDPCAHVGKRLSNGTCAGEVPRQKKQRFKEEEEEAAAAHLEAAPPSSRRAAARRGERGGGGSAAAGREEEEDEDAAAEEPRKRRRGPQEERQGGAAALGAAEGSGLRVTFSTKKRPRRDRCAPASTCII